jgi:type II secretion system (T2SS) protein M
MTIQDRDKRALFMLAGALVLGAIYWVATSASTGGVKASVVPVDGIQRSQKRLAYLRAAMATIQGKETVLKQVSAELSEREKGLLPGDSAAQAQAQLLQVLQKVAKSQTPPLEVRQVEFAQPRSFGDAYGLVTVSVTVDARIDELVNLLASLSAQPEAVATEEIRFGTANPRQKNMPVRLTVSGAVPRKLVPQKKGPAQF